MASDRFDVVVAGGGLTGLVAALSFANEGLSVAVVESRPSDAPGDGRVSAINVASERILRRLGAWEHVTEAAPFRTIRVWEAGSGPGIEFDAEAADIDRLGHIVENQALLAALERKVNESDIFWRRPARVAGVELTPDEVLVELTGRPEGPPAAPLATRLLVGADGSDSLICRLTGIAVRARDYGQQGIVCRVRPEFGHDDCAWQVFRPSGPLAFLPLADGRDCSIVWSAQRSYAEHLLELDDEDFRRALEQASEMRLGAIEWTGPRAAFPLRRIQATTYHAPRVALVGDAAHTIHPLAGQGVNLGLLDAHALAEAVGRAVRRGRDPGSEAALARYERARKGHNLAVQWAMDGFHHLFRPRAAPLRMLRGTGLALTHRCGPLKNLIVRLASGLDDSPAARP